MNNVFRMNNLMFRQLEIVFNSEKWAKLPNIVWTEFDKEQ